MNLSLWIEILSYTTAFAGGFVLSTLMFLVIHKRDIAKRRANNKIVSKDLNNLIERSLRASKSLDREDSYTTRGYSEI